MMSAGFHGRRTRALLLVGHGSHLNAFSSSPVYDHARRLRASGRFDEVVEAFWKEEPSLRDAIALIESDDIYIVPLFLAEGYFTRQVLPRELGLKDFRPSAGQRVHYCPPIGGHPGMHELVVERALAISRAGQFEPASATLVVIGHGTERHSTSGGTVYELVRSLRTRGEFATVTCGFLDESPGITEVLDQVNTANVILVPYFLAEGWHTAATIPRDLSLSGTRTYRDGRTLWYAPPVGTLPGISEIVLSIAVAAEGGSHEIESIIRPSSRPTLEDRPIVRARRHFFERLDVAGDSGFGFLRLWIRRSRDGTYQVIHESDRGTPVQQLVRSSDPESALEIARADASGRYRPLRFADTLKRGWMLENLETDGLWRVMSLLYPGAVLRWAAEGLDIQDRSVTDFAGWAARQTGMYDRIGSIGRSALFETVTDCCGSCLRTRRWTWDAESSGSDATSTIAHRNQTVETGMRTVPCLEPCTLFGSRAHQRMSDESTPLRSSPRPEPPPE